jgi:hypothetical protein
MRGQGPIQAIETRYAGCHFRSRLEARWAVFWDALEIPWDYEPQGFQTSAGGYLPDFFLPDMDRYVEIKGAAPSEADLAKCQGLAEHKDLIILVGSVPRTPDQISWLAWNPECTIQGPAEFFGVHLFHRCTSGWERWDYSMVWPFSPDRDNGQRTQDALTQARSARFEHGQSGSGRRP